MSCWAIVPIKSRAHCKRRLAATLRPAERVEFVRRMLDHVLLTVFIELPHVGPGASVMPQQHGALPEGMAWHYRLRLGGWSNALFSADGASATNEGTPVTPAADLRADLRAGTLVFTLPARALGTPLVLRGARIHVTTWDYDGRYRTLAATPAAFDFGGGKPGDPLLLDELTLTLH